jgi:hypothetical protein
MIVLVFSPTSSDLEFQLLPCLCIRGFSCGCGALSTEGDNISMRKPLTLLIVFVATFLLLNVSQSRADGLDTFVLSEPSNSLFTTVEWQLASAPDTTGSAIPGQAFFINVDPVLVSLDPTLQFSGPDTLCFFNGAAGNPGGFSGSFYGLIGAPQLYSGAETSPTFLTGTYQGIDPITGASATLVVNTPEPSTRILVFLGFLSLAGILIFRRVQV